MTNFEFFGLIFLDILLKLVVVGIVFAVILMI